jgi:hypothetical protein
VHPILCGVFQERAPSISSPPCQVNEDTLPASGQTRQRPVEWLNFFLADVQTGLGPFLAAYLAANGWNPASVGYALTFGGLVTVAVQTPAGAVVDAVHSKRLLVAVNLAGVYCECQNMACKLFIV